jgi:hypothetical protein
LTAQPPPVDRRPVRGASALFLATFTALGCAPGAGPPPAEPVTPPPSEHQPITELDALEHDLDVASGRLDAQLEKKRRAPVLRDEGEGKDEDKLKQQQGQPPPPPGPAKPPKPAPSEDVKAESRTESIGQVGAPCDVACRAFASMKRSAARICELAGSTHERCTRAKARVAEAERRIATAGCECKQRDEKLISSL